MKICNIGNKIISIGATAVLPGATEEVDDSFKGNDVIAAFESMGFISIADTAKKTAGKGGRKASAASSAVHINDETEDTNEPAAAE